MSDKQATTAAKIANRVLRETGDEGRVVRVANASVRRKKRGK